MQVTESSKLSLRSRNWLDIKWNTGALIANYIFNETNNARLNVKVFGIKADRANIGNLKPITIADTINPVTLQYDNRQLDRDRYGNIGFEARFLTDYNWGKTKQTFSGGIRLYRGKTDRSRLGTGDRGTGFNKNFVEQAQDLDLISRNAAAFAENIFRINDKLKIIPGIRFEHIVMDATGRLNYFANGTQNLIKPETRARNFILSGLGAEYNITSTTKLYSNYSQAYRPMLFYDVSVNPDLEIVDPELRDSKGYNFDFGYRGKISNYLSFDISGYRLQYNNRIGIITQQRLNGSFYNYRTNVGHSTSKGFEGLVEFNPTKVAGSKSDFDISLFASYSYTDARYGNFKVISKDNNSNLLVETNLKKNHVENAPQNILRTGITGSYKKMAVTYQYSYVDKAFADANNTIYETIAQVGLIPAYNVSDIHGVYKTKNSLQFKAGINNLFDARYFTRRAPSIPGPGALPADGRSFYVSVGAKF